MVLQPDGCFFTLFLGNGCGKNVRKLKIKKVDDKTMVIHTKKKAKIHTHEPKKASIKASNIYTVDRSSKIKGSKIATTENKKFRRSTIHPVDKAKKGMFRQYRAALKESKQSFKTKNSSIRVKAGEYKQLQDGRSYWCIGYIASFCNQ